MSGWIQAAMQQNTIFEKNISFAQMFLQLVLLPPVGHKEAIDTLGYLIASKLED